MKILTIIFAVITVIAGIALGSLLMDKLLKGAPGGQIEGIDFTSVSPYRLGRSLFNRVSGLLGRYLDVETMDLTRVGTIDWCVFRLDDPSKPTFPAADWKDSGAGITREIRIRGNIERSEATRFTGLGWGWTDGSNRKCHSRRQGDDDGMGIRAWIGADSAIRRASSGETAPGPFDAALRRHRSNRGETG